MYSGTDTPRMMWVSPFGNPRIKVCLLTPRGLSQATTSFVAFSCQGIHQMHFYAWSYNRKHTLIFEYWAWESSPFARWLHPTIYIFRHFLEFMSSMMFFATKIDNKNTKTQLLRTREARNKELSALLQPNSNEFRYDNAANHTELHSVQLINL